MILNFYNFTKYTPAQEIHKNLFFLPYIFLIGVLSSIFTIFFIKKFGMVDANYNLIIKDITYSHGPLIDNILNNHNFYQYIDGIKFYLAKTLFIPILIATIALISKNIFFVIIVKNILIFSIYYLVCIKFSINQKLKIFHFLLLLAIPIVIPYNLIVSLNFVYEDCIISVLLPSLFLCLISEFKNKYWFVSFILFTLYFVKTSMFLIVLLLPVAIILYEKKDNKKYIPVFFSAIAIMVWGIYGEYKTTRFPFGSAGSSLNSQVLAFSLNKNFSSYYPLKSTDIIPIKFHPNTIKNEWEFYDYYWRLNNNYIKKNYIQFIEDGLIKIKFILFNIRRDGALPDSNGNFNNEIRHSLIINKILFNGSLVFLLLTIIKNFKNIFEKNHFYFSIFLFLSLSPHIVAWATSKHLVAITSIAIIYLLNNFVFRKNNANNI